MRHILDIDLSSSIVRRDSTYVLVAQLRLESDCGFEHRVLIVVYIEPQQQEQ